MGTALATVPIGKKDKGHLVGWQGFTLRVPEEWDLTGFSGSEESGYLRVDDSREMGLEVKWATEPKKAKNPPDVSVRRESYVHALGKTAKRNKIAFESKDVDAPRNVMRPERTVAGFNWTGDRKAIGAVWHCAECRRTVIAQVLGDRSGRGGLSTVASDVLASIQCHSAKPGWRTWALYDLVTEVPDSYRLAGQELMNVYLRLHFTRGTNRLSVEQWALANMARRDQYLDVWVASNSKAEIREARYDAEAGEIHGHASLVLRGGLYPGTPVIHAARDAMRFKRPATRFEAVAWECEETNKVYAVQTLLTNREPSISVEVAQRTFCHEAVREGGPSA